MDPSHDLNCSDFSQPGSFSVGCNYWASHAGTSMWSDWQPEVINQDLKQLAGAGLQVLRVFPLWPDFQPIKQLRGGSGKAVEFRLDEIALPEDEVGKSGLSTEMLSRFRTFADLAQKHNLKLVVGLVTGWMSGRLFVPPGLDGLNVLLDPVAVQWEIRLVRYFVRHFKTHPAILAWDLGNECNCMAELPGNSSAWVWTASITNAIRAEDSQRMIVSGMHSLLPDREAVWRIQDQAELTDLLTTHPYPYFTPHCDQDPVNSMRTILHSTAESRFYADIGGKPCMAEEIGTLGPFLASESIAADFVRACLYSLWAHDCRGLMWWCAFDQLHLEHAPYDWAACERELGLIRQDRSLKPVLQEISHFRSQVLGNFPFRTLPSRMVEAVCIITEGQDSWGVAYSSFVLAKQAGFDLEFQTADQPIKPAALYLMPSVSGMSAISRRRWLELLDKVKDGATLYLSHDDCLLSPFTEYFGLEILTRQRRSELAHLKFNGTDGAFTVGSKIRLNLHPLHSQVLAHEIDGNPAFTRAQYGRGEIYFLSVPIEQYLANEPGGFDPEASGPFRKIYQEIVQPFLSARAVTKNAPDIGVTEHPIDENQRILIAINYSPKKVSTNLNLTGDWRLKQVITGNIVPGDQLLQLSLPANDGAVFLLSQQNH